MTYSIAARDPSTGEIGVGVQSHHFGVGPLVIHGEAGIGVAVTQSFARPDLGAVGISSLRLGDEAATALGAMIHVDASPARSQLAVVDASGATAAHTGERCVGDAGHVAGGGVTCQANMVDGDVWSEMLVVFERTRGALGDRLLAALWAAEAAGGDLRGQQSAALMVLPAERGARAIIDLRVDDHPAPLAELARLDEVRSLSGSMSDAFELAARQGVDSAIDLLERTQIAFGDANREPTVWAGVILGRHGRLDEAAALFRRVISLDPRWERFVRQLAVAGLVPPPVVRAAVTEEP